MANKQATIIEKPFVAQATTNGTAPKPSVVSRALRMVVWTLATVCIGLVAAESLLAFAHAGEDDVVDFMPVVGFYHPANKFITWRKEGYSQSKNNTDAFRDAEFTVAKPAGVMRIAVVGDSMTEGYQVGIDETYAKQLENVLRARGQNVQVMNFGMSCFSPVQTLYLFKEKIAKYKPDMVILGYDYFSGQNNIELANAGSDLPRPFITLDKNNQLTTQWRHYDNWYESTKGRFFRATNWLRSHSRIWTVLTNIDGQLSGLAPYRQLRDTVQILVVGKSKAPSSERTALTAREVLGQDAKFVPSVFDPPVVQNLPEPEIPATATSKQAAEIVINHNVGQGYRNMVSQTRDGFRITSSMLSLFNETCREANCNFAVVALPANYNSVLYFRELGWLKQFAAQERFQFVDSNQFFPHLAPTEKSPLFFGVHFTKDGHELLAKELADRLTFQ
jgi:hypothetical protein